MQPDHMHIENKQTKQNKSKTNSELAYTIRVDVNNKLLAALITQYAICV